MLRLKKRLKSTYEAAKADLKDISSVVSVAGFDCTKFISDCDEAITKELSEASSIIKNLQDVVNTIPHKSNAPEKSVLSQLADQFGLGRNDSGTTMDSTSSDFADDTVYSQFFESTDMMPKSDTSYFLKSDDDRIDDMLKILDSM